MVSKIKRGTKMSDYIKKAIEMVNAAKPASGFRPETPKEWDALLRANEELGYAMFREQGMSYAQARQLAKQIYGGQAGRLLLEMSFMGNSHA
jgi:hypothetical protein